VPVVNAGDGYNEHPTQALGDVWTMHRALGGLDGATIGLVGDVSIRSLRAISLALSRFRLERLLLLPAPGTVCPPEVAAVLDERGIAWQYVDDVADLLRDADAVETIGVRHPDHHLPRQEEVDWNRETPRRFRIDRALIEALGTDVPILHPGARKDELATDVDDLPNALYAEQVRNGLWQRMAVLARLCGAPLPLRL
jgi:aspartate carbamoyltransferase catalytic subunit